MRRATQAVGRPAIAGLVERGVDQKARHEDNDERQVSEQGRIEHFRGEQVPAGDVAQIVLHPTFRPVPLAEACCHEHYGPHQRAGEGAVCDQLTLIEVGSPEVAFDEAFGG